MSVPGSLPAEDSLPFPLLLSEWAEGEGHIGGCCKFWGPPDWLPNTPRPAPGKENNSEPVQIFMNSLYSDKKIKIKKEYSIFANI